MQANPVPKRLNLIKDQRLEIDWEDGRQSVYSMLYLRWMCPCAKCKTVRQTDTAAAGKKSLLKVLPGNSHGPVQAENAELVGNYALRIDWSDQHGSGIYSFAYLHDISPALKENATPTAP